MRVAAIYARVSTPGQQEDGTSLETQVTACLDSAQEQGDIVPPEYIFREQASGADTNRPLLAKLRQLVRDGKIDVIIIYHPDRLSRDATDLMMLWQEITEQGVEIRLLQGPAGTSPEDKLLRFIFGYKSEAERRDILERTMRGKRNRPLQMSPKEIREYLCRSGNRQVVLFHSKPVVPITKGVECLEVVHRRPRKISDNN